MDRFSIEFSGTELDVNKMISAFSSKKVRRFHQINETTFVEDGIVKKRRIDSKFAETSVVFESDGSSLLAFLKEIRIALESFDRSKIEETVVWCLMERQGQINGELSSEEIEELGNLTAHYCWSVL